MKGQAAGGNTADANKRLKGKQNITHRTMDCQNKTGSKKRQESRTKTCQLHRAKQGHSWGDREVKNCNLV